MSLSGRCIALTGATGFIGRRLTTFLLRHGVEVRALARDTGVAAKLLPAGVELVTGDLGNRAALDALLAPADSVIHLAGSVRGRSYRDFERTNVEGTEQVLRAALAAPSAPALLLVSSLAAREPGLSWYARSKREGEQRLQESGGSLRWCALRPPAVYGPGDREMLPVFQWMQRGLAPVAGKPAHRLSLMHVDDVAAACIAALQAPACNGQVFELGDGREGGYDWHEIAAIASEVFGRPVTPRILPAVLLNTVAWLNLASARLSGHKPMLTPGKLRELRHPDWVTECSAMTRASGWTPTIDLRQGLAELCENGTLTRK